MRIISFILAFCLSFNVLAASGVQELEKHLDDFHYSLSVEWDQKDPAFHEAKTKEFFAKLETLIKEEGLTKEQMLAVAESKMGDKAALEALKLRFSLLDKNSSAEDLAKVLKESSKDLYDRGASWNGAVIAQVTALVIVGALIGYAIWWNSTHECVAYEEQYVCQTYGNCQYYGGSYNDPYYGPGYYCPTQPYTVCGMSNVCTEYARK